MEKFREIKTNERITERTEETKKLFMAIKPETNMTKKEADDFWNTRI